MEVAALQELNESKSKSEVKLYFNLRIKLSFACYGGGERITRM